jgi:hypothetical protein
MDLRRLRNRGFFFAALALLAAVWILRVAFRLAGTALHIVLLAVIVLLALGWATRKNRSA